LCNSCVIVPEIPPLLPSEPKPFFQLVHGRLNVSAVLVGVPLDHDQGLFGPKSASPSAGQPRPE
jgi:hypothetical protein